ncbi:MAG: hypothetical protein O7G85_10030 [Planctomycetota bacterium]|nr:hypothetical protein [Planctomycetota bacterium]
MTRNESCRVAVPPLLFSCLLLFLQAGCAKAPPPPGGPIPDSLQGDWEGEGPSGEISITIKGNTLRYAEGPDSWYETTFAIPVDTDPQQLHATITDSSSGTSGIGDVIKAIFKIEDGTLTLAVEGGGDSPPTSFTDDSSLYILKKGQPQEESTEATTP